MLLPNTKTTCCSSAKICVSISAHLRVKITGNINNQLLKILNSKVMRILTKNSISNDGVFNYMEK